MKFMYTTDYWKELKAKILQKTIDESGNRCGKCQRCGYEPWKPCLQLHHLTYKDAGHEDVSQVLLVCPKCHAELHGKTIPVHK